jgi:AraC family transcriptional activator of pobA
MTTTTTAPALLPKYPFEPDPASGHPSLRIHRNDNMTNYRKSDFLIPHRKDYYFMAFVKKGSSRHWIDMTPYDLQPDTFYFTVPHQVHLKESTQPLTGISLSFNNDFLASDSEGLLKSLPIIQNPHNGHALSLQEENLTIVEDLLNKILTEYHARETWQQPVILSYVKVLLVHLSRLYRQQFTEELPGSDRTLLKNYLAHIEDAYRNLHEVTDYAALMNISAGHLSELIKQQSGLPAIAHIHERLILEAKRLLFHTDYAIKEIAFHLGFEDPSYFNRFFKRLTGDTPALFREKFREMYH